MVISKVVLVYKDITTLTSVEIATMANWTVDMQRKSTFLIPGSCRAIRTFISPDVDKLVLLAAACYRGCDSDDVEVFKWGSQIIRIYRAVCVVSASSSPVSRVISEPKKITPCYQIRLPVWGIAAERTWVHVIVKDNVTLRENVMVNFCRLSWNVYKPYWFKYSLSPYLYLKTSFSSFL